MKRAEEDQVISIEVIKCTVCGTNITLVWHESEIGGVKRVTCPKCGAKYEIDPSLSP